MGAIGGGGGLSANAAFRQWVRWWCRGQRYRLAEWAFAERLFCGRLGAKMTRPRTVEAGAGGRSGGLRWAKRAASV